MAKDWVTVQVAGAAYREMEKHVPRHATSVQAYVRQAVEDALFRDSIRDNHTEFATLIEAVLDVVRTEAKRKR
jgi:hypothetical protein